MAHSFFWVALGIWLVCDMYVLLCRGSKKGRRKGEHHSKYVMVALIVTGMFGGIALSAEGRQAFMEDFNWFRSLSLFLIPMGIIIRMTAIHQLGKAFSIDVGLANGNGLYKEGLYSLIRHPSYLGELLCFLGVAVAFNHPVSSGFAFLFPLAAFSYRIIIEEKFLRKHYEEEFTQYARETKRLIPYVF
ncbi:MAG: isoprenylcysteine carboxylmethyltransferase family protein [Clostridia bacterium]